MSDDDKQTEIPVAEKRTNVFAAVGIGFVCVVIGLPLWWQTTEVYRVSLPYSDIDILYDTQIEYTVDLHVISLAENVLSAELAALSKQLMEQLDGRSSAEVKAHYRTTVREAKIEERNVWKSIQSAKELDSQFASILPDETNTYFVLLLPTSKQVTLEKPTIGINRKAYIQLSNQDMVSFSTEIVQFVRTSLVREGAVNRGYNSAKGARDLKPDKETLRSMRSSPGYDVTLTLVSPRPDLMDPQWDVQTAVDTYLKPFISKLDGYVTVNIKSQVLFFTKLHVKPKKKKDEYFFTSQDLPHMINPLEAKLVSPASTNPELNFLVYVPSKDQYPLYIQDDQGNKAPSNSFLSPQWGGVQIYNVAPSTVNTSLPYRPQLDMKPVMEVILAQIRLLLDLQTQAVDNVVMLPLDKSSITNWEVDGWLRSRCVENLATATSTLKSLLGKISNIVINDDIGKEVETAVSTISKSLQLLAAGSLVEAFTQSRTALMASEKAFFDPSLLELLYFPEDQKFAIYIPLFLPISFPVMASLYQALKWYKGTNKPKQA